jgi:UDP-N-acetylglucosamine 2-epimerase (non-hydrolysing)
MILLSYGTRPEYIKIKSLINLFDKENYSYKLIFTGQHENINEEFRFHDKIIIEKGENRLDSIIKSCMNKLDLLKNWNITHVMVQGDTTSAIAIALSAFHHTLKVIHLEAGLRTYDKENPFPEEINRQIISRIADIHLCPTKESALNLSLEKNGGSIHVVGNTIIDNLLSYKNKCEYTNKILVTLHRRENHHWINQWFIAINLLAKLYPEHEFILPIHPNPNVQKYRYILKNVNVINSLPYDQMLNLLVKTKLVITDSGGLQEECSFFNKKCLTCRKTTERPEALEQSTFLVERPNLLMEMFIKHIDNYKINYDCPFGDGHSAEKIYKILKEILL